MASLINVESTSAGGHRGNNEACNRYTSHEVLLSVAKFSPDRPTKLDFGRGKRRASDQARRLSLVDLQDQIH
jgi:hypothetical protein